MRRRTISPHSTKARAAARAMPRLGASPRTALATALSVVIALSAHLTANGRDILRPGNGSSTTSSQASASGAFSASANVSASGTNAQTALARTSEALSAMQQMQQAAQKAALAGKGSAGAKLPVVPNGLGVGGLQLSKQTTGGPPPVQGANLPVQGVSKGETFVTITQTQQDAILNWQTFNVGKNTTVDFNQSRGGADATKWIALNEITDPSGVPSQILGSIHAQGQVYLIDQNGIIFGGSSQIDVHALSASSLPIDTNLISRGLLSTSPDVEFLFSALPTGAFTPVLAGTAIADPMFTPAVSSVTIAHGVVAGSTPTVSAKSASGSAQLLTAETDYTVGKNSRGETVVTLTLSGLAKANGDAVTISYAHAASAAVALTEPTYQLAQSLAPKTSPSVSFTSAGGTTTLRAGVDFKIETIGGKSVLAFTSSGLIKIDGAPITVSYENTSHQPVTDPAAAIAGPTYKFPAPVTAGTTPTFTVSSGSTSKTLVTGTDYTLNAATNTVTFLAAGLEKIAGESLHVSYTGQLSDPSFNVSITHELGDLVATTPNVKVTFGTGAATTTLTPTTDYTYHQEADGKTLLTLTTAGLQALASAGAPTPQLTVSYNEAKFGDVVVEAGANLTSPASAANVGGRITLIGPNVTNAGTISTPDGQTILAAGYQVGFTAHASSDPSLRGLDTFVGQVPFGGSATNQGLIEAPQADVTIAGKSVNQLGVIDGSTSVSLNGRVDLLASYGAYVNPSSQTPGTEPFLQGSTGMVTLGAGSVTRILPDLSSTETIIGTQLALPSVVNAQGFTIHLESDATILAPNAMAAPPTVGTTVGNSALDSEGNILAAGVALSTGAWAHTNTVNTQFFSTGGQIYLDSGATIDVSGSTNVPVPVAQNIVAVQLLGAQLANSPLQRTGVLHGQTIYIDLRQTGTYNGFQWVGTPLADASGFVNIIQRGVGQLTVAGGTVSLAAGGSVVMQPGSEVNVSGGSIAYKGGMVQTTRLVSGGDLYDISQATPDLVYQGIYTGSFTESFPKYNLAYTFTGGLLLNGVHYENSYLQGGNGGSIAITAPSVALDGTLLGATTAGPHQRSLNSLSNSANLPNPSSLSLTFTAEQLLPGLTTYTAYAPAPPDLSFESGVIQAPAAPFAVDSAGDPLLLPAARRAQVFLSPAILTAGGFGNLTINNSDGRITVPAHVTLNAAPGGSITLLAANMEIDGKVAAPGGTLTFQVTDVSPYNPYFTNPVAFITAHPNGFGPNPSRGLFTLGSTASLSTAGLIVDDRPTAPAPDSLPLAIAGGSITIQSYSANLKTGSTIDASGGLNFSASGNLTYGNGGKIDIEAGIDQQYAPLYPGNSAPFIASGTLAFNASLQSFAGPGAAGGSLALLAPVIQVGGATAAPNTLLLSPEFFSQGGFSAFSLTGLGAAGASRGQYVPAVSIAPGTVVDPVAENWIASTSPAATLLTPTVLPEAQRTPVSLSFTAKGVKDFHLNPLNNGDLVMSAGARIQTDAGGSVAFNGQTVAILGSIIAPGGSISIAGAGDSTVLSNANLTAPAVTVEIGPNSLLSTAGTTVLSTADPRGFTVGTIFNGGTIQVSGNIVAEAGSILDVSGATGVLDMRPTFSNLTVGGAAPGSLFGSFLGYPVVPTRVDSNGGFISLKGGQELFTDATLVGAAGGPSAQGGALSVQSGIFMIPNVGGVQTAVEPTLVVTESGSTIPAKDISSGPSVIGSLAFAALGKAIPGFGYDALGHIAASSFASGGFSTISLIGTVEFSGPVSITADQALHVGGRSTPSGRDGGVIIADQSVSLSAPYVQLGLAFQPPGSPSIVQGNYAPTYGPGNLTVSGSLIDIGSLSLQNIGSANFVANNGDIRGDGTLDVQGHIGLAAGQIYPPTGVAFNIFAYDYTTGSPTKQVSHPGSITISSSGIRDLPLSAGGSLSLYASTIDQGGILRAPIGTINLGWDGSGSAPVDPVAGSLLSAPTTNELKLLPGSVTSVSAYDPATGQPLLIPYGINLNGTSWISPNGADITAGGVPGKAINLSAKNVTDEVGATIDLRGGGDLYAYRFVAGNGGTNDILATSSNFAILPGFQAAYAPYAPYNFNNTNFTSVNAVTQTTSTDAGYVNATLQPGDQVYLTASNGLPAGVYTLLPARYALLPGAFLVTPQSGTPLGSQPLPDGSSLVSGYRFNGMNVGQTGQPLVNSFVVDPQAVVKNAAEYDSFYGSSFLSQGAIKNGAAVPRLPIDAGQLVFQATQSLVIHGTVDAQAPTGGQAGLVDISSASDIIISDSGIAAKAGQLVLQSSEINSFGAESVLIGGVRSMGSNGTTVTVATNNITVENAGSPLSVPDLILVANKSLTLDAGAEVEASGTLAGGAQSLVLNGDGTLLRVSGSSSATVIRSGVNVADTAPTMTIDAKAVISGGSITLDSSHATTLDQTAVVHGTDVNLNSGQISLQLNDPGSLPSTNYGLVLTNATLQSLERSAQSLSLLSYTSIDVYGSGQVGTDSLASLALHAPEIRGDNTGGGTATFVASTIILDNAPGTASPGSNMVATGNLAFHASTIQLGSNPVAIDQFNSVALDASAGILFHGTGSLAVQGALAMATPLITGASGAVEAITAGGAVTISGATGANPSGGGGLGASLTVTGTSIAENTVILLPSGIVVLNATGTDPGSNTPALSVGGAISVAGTAQNFFGDLTKYTGGGQITLTATDGSVDIAKTGTVDVSANAGGGDAGALTINALGGNFTSEGTYLGHAGAGGQAGSFSLDAGSLLPTGAPPQTVATLATLSTALTAGGFTQSISIRDRNDQSVQVGGMVIAHNFTLSVDSGSIDVTGTVDAAGQHASGTNAGTAGGSINLIASANVTVESDAILDASGGVDNAAGKGGAVSLEAGSETNGTPGTGFVSVLGKINLSVDSITDPTASALLGQFTGTLHIRSPQTTIASTVLAPGSIENASSIVVEGYQIFDLTQTGGVITTTVESAVAANGTSFAQNTGAALSATLSSGNTTTLPNGLLVVPGAEIIYTAGSITLPADWNLGTSTYRFDSFGTNDAPGVLTIRAAGNLVFNGALSDGFNQAASPDGTLVNAPLLSQNTSLPANVQSWSYNLTAGADLTAADSGQVQSLAAVSKASSDPNYGSLELGVGFTLRGSGANLLTDTSVAGHYQVIRTGSGDINIAAARNVELLNPFATIYTAGTQINLPTTPGISGNETITLPNGTLFDSPVSTNVKNIGLGAAPKLLWNAQYSLAGGNVTITAGQDILRPVVSGYDNELQLPVNWLYRQGSLSASGDFLTGPSGNVLSTSWWIDFSNFFEGVGALGGGNVSMIAGRNIVNVDAVVPTNALMGGHDASGNVLAPSAANLLELGGGNLLVRAGGDINGGVYYVERGAGVLNAGGQILTNSARASAAGGGQGTWLPTTLFLGNGSFDVTALGNITIGPAANPFLLPDGLGNISLFQSPSYFSTYGASDQVNVTSIGGDVTLKETGFVNGINDYLLDAWFKNILVYNGASSVSYSQPWLRLNVLENQLQTYPVLPLLPPSLEVAATSGNINIVGNITLSPAPRGTVELAAQGSINALQPAGLESANVQEWIQATINLSDADPNTLPSITSPTPLLGVPFENLFNDSGSTLGAYGLLQTKDALHAPGLLHTGDPQPVYIYAETGSISGLELFSGKEARVLAGADITNVAFYVQNVSANNITVISAGRDLIPYDLNSPLQTESQSPGNSFGSPSAQAGDLQISGPGTLEVLAGRNLDLGQGRNPNDPSDLDAGINSIGNARDPYLPFAGADVVVAAGLGSGTGASGGGFDFTTFINQFVKSSSSARYFSELSTEASTAAVGSAPLTSASFGQLPAAQQDLIALDIFYLALRDAGRDHNAPTSPNYGNYNTGFAAIASLFPTPGQGDLTLSSKAITTASGGNISILAPGGQVSLGDLVATPPPGIVTQDGGNISIFAHGDVDIGVERIFTLRGGNEIIWSSDGNIAAGSSSKTVLSAPPTRVLVDPQSADVDTDLAGLATGGGIGVLATVAGVPTGNVDLIAPNGVVNAGDAGIRATGNLSIAAVAVLNASNIQVAGSTTGTPTAAAAPAISISAVTAGNSSQGAASQAAQDLAKQNQAQPPEEPPSIITVEVIGYGGGEGDSSDSSG